MRISIVVDDELMAAVMKASGAKTKRETVELDLRMLLQLRRQKEIRKYRGKLDWSGDLGAMRQDG